MHRGNLLILSQWAFGLLTWSCWALWNHFERHKLSTIKAGLAGTSGAGTGGEGSDLCSAGRAALPPRKKLNLYKRSLLQPALQKEHKCNSMGKDEILWQSMSATSHLSLCLVLNGKWNSAFCAPSREGRPCSDPLLSGARGPFWP